MAPVDSRAILVGTVYAHAKALAKEGRNPSRIVGCLHRDRIAEAIPACYSAPQFFGRGEDCGIRMKSFAEAKEAFLVACRSNPDG